MLFILFNGGGAVSQWHQFQGRSSNLVHELKKLGDVYEYNPNFYFDDETLDKFIESDQLMLFDQNDLDLELHCKKLYDRVKDLDDTYFLISHSRGIMYAHVFGNLYQKQIVGYINIDGGKPKSEIHTILDDFKDKYSDIDLVNNDVLYELFHKLKTHPDQKKEIKAYLSKIVQYHQYKQYPKTEIKFHFPTYILNNIYDDDDINIDMHDYTTKTLKWKIEFNRDCEKHKNVKSVWYVGKEHWLYTFNDVVSDMIGFINDALYHTNLCNKQIYIIRHGETDWNKLGFVQGSRNDIPLNDEGITQSQKVAEYMKKLKMEKNIEFDLVLCSPMIRTKQTAEIICDKIDYDSNKIMYMDDIKEIDHGLLAIGKKLHDLKDDPFYDDFFSVMEKYDNHNNHDKIKQHETKDDIPDILITKYKVESNYDILKRAQKVIDFIKKTKHKKIIIVTHSGLINNLNRVILNCVEEIKGDQSKGKNCNLTYYKLEHNKFKLILAPSTFFL